MYVCVSCMNIMKCKPNNTMVIYVLPYIYIYMYILITIYIYTHTCICVCHVCILLPIM